MEPFFIGVAIGLGLGASAAVLFLRTLEAGPEDELEEWTDDYYTDPRLEEPIATTHVLIRERKIEL